MQIRFAGFSAFDNLKLEQKLQAMEIAEEQHRLLEESSGASIPLKIDTYENSDKSHRVVVETSGSSAPKLDRNIHLALSKEKIKLAAYQPKKIDCSGTSPATAKASRTSAKRKKEAAPVVELDRPQRPPAPKVSMIAAIFSGLWKKWMLLKRQKGILLNKEKPWNDSLGLSIIYPATHQSKTTHLRARKQHRKEPTDKRG